MPRTSSSTLLAPVAARQRCPQCLRALRSCICALARPVEHSVELLILQHPMEVHEAKGTARLLHLCLPHSRILVGEQLPPADLQQALFGDWRADAHTGTGTGSHTDTGSHASSGHTKIQPLLLYPDLPAQVLQASEPLPEEQAVCATQAGRLAPVQRLVVLDGTWRKSRKMLYLNPLLAQLPRLSLDHVTGSAYRIRKAQASGQLSSFEAAALALAQLQGWGPQHPAVLQLDQVFHALMDQHERLRPPATPPVTPSGSSNGHSDGCN